MENNNQTSTGMENGEGAGAEDSNAFLAGFSGDEGGGIDFAGAGDAGGDVPENVAEGKGEDVPGAGTSAPEDAPADDAGDAASKAELVHKLKYNGEEREVSTTELISMAQKGMNYDKVQSRLSALEQSPELQVLDAYAKANGMTRAEYTNYLWRAQQQAEVNHLEEQGVPEDVARQMATLRDSEHQLRQREAERQRLDIMREVEAKEKHGFVELAQAYPELKEIPPEVGALIAKGVPPLYAYKAHEVGQLKTQLAAQKAAAKNTKNAPGSASGLGDGQETDAFLLGFMGGN